MNFHIFMLVKGIKVLETLSWLLFINQQDILSHLAWSIALNNRVMDSSTKWYTSIIED